jgi:hypothetical protein
MLFHPGSRAVARKASIPESQPFMPSFFSPSRWLSLFAFGLLALVGCEKDEIRSYTVRRTEPETVEAKVRLLVAVFENGKQQWFFKLAGPVEEVTAHAKDFSSFVESARFTDKPDDPVEWKVPQGWEKGPPGEFRFASFFLGPKGKAPELTVFKFDRISSLVGNVERWCRQDLGRPALREAELVQYTKVIRAGEKAGVLIDLTGPGPRGGKAPPMGGGGPHAGMGRPKKLPLTYTPPAGWQETGPRSAMGIVVLTAFQVRDGDEKAEATVIALPGESGALLANVNRWRGQVGLNDVTQAQFDKDPPAKIRCAGENAPYHDFNGPRQRMLLVTVRHGGQMWYFKMLGSADVVGKNKSKFESFVQSVKFTGAADE